MKVARSLILATALAACATTPVTGRRQLVIVSEQEMDALGEKSFREVLSKFPPVKDEAVTTAVTDVAKRIATASGAHFEWQFAVLQSNEVNAFCLPGGRIGVFSGILPIALNDAGLAAVLGHEVAHATAHHAAERVSQAMLISGVLQGVDKAMSNQKSRQLIMAALGLGSQFGIMMPFSRKQEREADEIGLYYMAGAGYNPEEAIKLWERMAAAEKSRPPEFLSTHPDPQRRIANLKKLLPRAMKLYNKSNKQKNAKLPLPPAPPEVAH